jgi:hypothetical protein
MGHLLPVRNQTYEESGGRRADIATGQRLADTGSRSGAHLA